MTSPSKWNFQDDRTEPRGASLSGGTANKVALPLPPDKAGRTAEIGDDDEPAASPSGVRPEYLATPSGAEPCVCTWRSTATRPTRPSCLHGRSGPAGAFSFPARTLP